MTRRFFIGGGSAFGAFGAFGGARLVAAGGYGAEHVPNLRFGVLSDIHLVCKGKGDFSLRPDHDTRPFEQALVWFRSQDVDAVMLTGDIADQASGCELLAAADAWNRVFPEDRAPDGRRVEKLFVYGNHDELGGHYWNCAQIIWPDEKMRAEQVIESDMGGWWKKAFHEDYSRIYRKDIRGYTFIGQHWQFQDGGPKCRFELTEPFMAKAGPTLDPELPFFYFQHAHLKDTCYGSWAWGHDTGISTKVLSTYPNAVTFSGHSHYSLADERSIWQGAFTSLGTSSTSFIVTPRDSRLPGGYLNDKRILEEGWDIDPKLQVPPNDSPQGMLVSVYDDCITFRRRDFALGVDLGEEWAQPLAASEPKPFAFAEHARRFVAPEFAADAKLPVRKVRAKKGEKAGVRLDIPAATAVRGARPIEYAISIASEDGAPFSGFAVANGFCVPVERKADFDAATVCVIARDRLPKGEELRFEVTPLDCFGHRGKPLVSRCLKI